MEADTTAERSTPTPDMAREPCTKSAKAPGLMRLPAEMRNGIYNLVSAQRAPSLIDLDRRSIHLADQPLLRVCKDVHWEFRSIFQEDSTTRLEVEIKDFNFDGLITFLGSAPFFSKSARDKSLHICIRITDVLDQDEVERRIHRWSHCITQDWVPSLTGIKTTLCGLRITYSVPPNGIVEHFRDLVKVYHVLYLYGRGVSAVVDEILAAIDVCLDLLVMERKRRRQASAEAIGNAKVHVDGARRTGECSRRLTYAEVLRRSLGRSSA